MGFTTKCETFQLCGKLYGQPIEDMCSPYVQYGVNELQPIGRFLGNAPNLNVQYEVVTREIPKTYAFGESCGTQTVTATRINLELSDASKENLAQAFWGQNFALEKGQDVDCEPTNGTLVCGIPVEWPVEGVDPNSVQIWEDDNGQKGTELVRGQHFDADQYCLTAFRSIGPCYWISYGYGCVPVCKTKFMKAQPPKMNLTLKGFNKGSCSKDFVKVKIFGVELTNTGSLQLLGQDIVTLNFEGLVYGVDDGIGGCKTIEMCVIKNYA